MAKEHNHSTISNTDEVFRTFIGCEVKGVLHDSNSEGGEVIILVFSCGWGLAFNGNGSYWTEEPFRIQQIIVRTRDALDGTQQELKHILELAGESD